MENVRVYVIGRLGELVKKIIELELLVEEDSKNEIAILELASYYEVLEAWPLEKPEDRSVLLMDFRLAFRKYALASDEFMTSVASKNTHRLEIDSLAYLKAREIVKSKMKALNAVGRFVGNIPILTMKANTQGASDGKVDS